MCLLEYRVFLVAATAMYANYLHQRVGKTKAWKCAWPLIAAALGLITKAFAATFLGTIISVSVCVCISPECRVILLFCFKLYTYIFHLLNCLRDVSRSSAKEKMNECEGWQSLCSLATQRLRSSAGKCHISILVF